jgi:hypothetical protein
MCFLIVYNIALTPLAQSIWGNKLIGYKNFFNALNSVMMIAYSKGNLEILLDINVVWSLIFILMYYLVSIFFLHAAFHQV